MDKVIKCSGLLLLAMLIFGIPCRAQQEKPDSLQSERRSNQNALLNASADSKPRFISLGIPEPGLGIMEDGLPTAMSVNYFPGYWSWHNSLATESLELTGLDESALQMGIIGYFPMSSSKLEASRFEGGVDFSINHFGRIQADVNILTPLGKGWSLDLNVYQDLNRGSNHLDLTYLQEHIQYYKAGISKRFAKGRFFATYLYMHTRTLSDPYGPFIFVGDGSVKPYGDFVLGKDQYLPATATFDYIDVMTGESGTRRFVEDGGIPAHVITAGAEFKLRDDIQLSLSSRLRLTGANLTNAMLSSIEQGNSHYSYEDGTPYDGAVQTRYMLYYQNKLYEWFTTAMVKGEKSKYVWNVGANVWSSWTSNHMMTSNFAYEAAKDPKLLCYDGVRFYGPNAGAQYVDGGQHKFALFGLYQWNISHAFNLRAGLRLEYGRLNGDAAFNLDGKDNNTRTEGWNLALTGVTKTPFKVNNLNGAASLVANYKFGRGWGLEANAIATRQHAELWQFGEADPPTDKPKNNYLFRGGINYKNKWLDFQSLVMLFRQDNNYMPALWTHELTHDAGGYPAGYNESLYIGTLYSMRVLAWTTDFILKPFKGFSFHGFLTLRSPRYSNYIFRPTFSDGYSEEYDFSGKQITGSSAVELEMEPSYEIGRWRIWASARYYSRQYVNITNSLYFNSHWETFAGVDFSVNEKMRLSVNVVNFLNQTGASAGIQAASLATDPTPFKNYLTSGTYLRPFTLEFGVKLRF